MTKAAGFAVGISVVVLAAIAAVVFLRGGDADKTLELAMNGANCVITTSNADKDVSVGNGKKVTWHVHNACNSDQLVLVGNFRTTQNDPQSVMDCKAGIIETTWPFKKLDQSVRAIYVPSAETQDLTLKEAKNNTSNPLTFYFDICMGGKKVDPRLDIDP
jgi:hypothetical protein